MKDLGGQISVLASEIYSDVDHGECFYEIEMLLKFHVKLDKMKEISTKYYLENKSEMEDEET